MVRHLNISATLTNAADHPCFSSHGVIDMYIKVCMQPPKASAGISLRVDAWSLVRPIKGVTIARVASCNHSSMSPRPHRPTRIGPVLELFSTSDLTSTTVSKKNNHEQHVDRISWQYITMLATTLLLVFNFPFCNTVVENTDCRLWD